ncbi:MAG: right-handed parallel beta-helix repeat-containing protein [Chloroflexi bacterium]|nr:right-handed parallel beta-helix repeat-containing protein [Chloroflexota bacterium]MDA1148364.1 right-handed parallel beta-helix repeat-containing protein [Chloroflexota bacterium]
MRAQSIPDGAVSIAPDQNAAAVVAKHPAGTTFVFAPGTHRGVSIRPRNGDRYLGRPGAVLNGASLLTGFAARDGYWAVGGQTSELAPHGGCEYLANGTRYDSCGHPEQLFVDGATWRQVSSLGQLAAGRWYFDYGRDRVYVGANPAGRTIELSTTPQAFRGKARDVRIAGLVIERYASRAQMGALDGSDGDGWVVEANELRLNHGYGLRTGQRMHVLNNYVHHNGQLGVGGVGNDLLVTGNEIAYNHTAGFLEEWEAGGTKFAVTRNLVFRGNWVHHNAGRGIWTDIDNVNVLIANNLAEWNTRGGIVHEISYDAVIRDNVARFNGLGFDNWAWGAQILVQNSADVRVTGNSVTVAAEGGNGITVVDQPRGNGPRGPYRSERVIVTDNVIRHLGMAGWSGAPKYECPQGNVFDRNVYEAPANWFKQDRIFWCGGGLRLDEFRGAGQERNGTAVTRS